MYSKIEIYTGPRCNFCDLAKILLDKNKLQYKEIKLEIEPEKKEEMIKRTNGKKTIPQIFIDNKYIGGYTELHNYFLNNKLNK